MVGLIASALLAALSVKAVLADTPVACGTGKPLCPEAVPCCSQYGQCGVGAYCLGGCDPLNSHGLDSCVPAPVCSSNDYTFPNLNAVAPNTKYLGDASKSNWVSSGTPLVYGGNLLLTMPPNSVGTLLASNHYVWYGKITAKLKTSRGAGVVTAFILLSDVKDEIDFEFVGVELDIAQTNFYFQGITDYNNGKNATVDSDTFENWHTYEIDWQPDTITWSVDGNVVRTLDKATTFNSSTNQYNYPQTPARVQLSLWPAGLPSNGAGTISWGGGLVDWDSTDIKNNGYYYAQFQEVTVECYNPPPGVQQTGTKSYIYTGEAGTNNTVEITNKNTVLKSLLGTGTNMSADYSSASASASGSKSTSSDLATVPGLSGAGPGTNGQRPDSGSSGSGTGNSGSGSGASTGAGSASTGFVQGSGSNGSGSSGAAPVGGEKVLKGSLFAVIVAVVGLLAM